RRPDDRRPPGRGHAPGLPARSGRKGGTRGADRSRRAPETRRLKLRLLGGLVVWIATAYCGTRTRAARGRGREGTGAYPELAGLEMAGQHVVAQVDGGRVRVRTRVETKKRKGVKYRRKIRVEWREPKLLILYLSDRKGRMVKGTRPWIDGTMNGPDHLMELLAFHLHRLGAARAKAVSFVSDGAPWIWNRLDWVERRAGLDPKRTERVLDCCHAVH